MTRNQEPETRSQAPATGLRPPSGDAGARSLIPALLTVLLAPLCSSCGGGAPAGPAVTLKGARFEVEVAATEKARRTALIRWTAAPEGRGYLLAWPRERFLKLESEHARATFDVAFLDRAGKVLEVGALPIGHAEGIVPQSEAAYALLVAAGTLAKLGVQPGQAAELSDAVRAAAPQELPVMKIGEVTATVELALTEPERNHGLMFRPRMSADDGMLFAYESEGTRSFWMKNTLIPLDIAFFKADGTLLNVNETPTAADPRGNNPPTSPSDGPARFVLEMNRGWFKRKGLVDESGRPRPGLRAQFPPEAPRGSFSD